MRIAGTDKWSVVDGVGVRYTLFVQGCKHCCPGCHNPGTWPMDGGVDIPIDEIIASIEAVKLPRKLVTISGGDPFYQPEELLELCTRLKALHYNIWVYTGFTFEQLENSPCLPYIDVLVDGLFQRENRTLALRFRGSPNQRLIDVQETLKSGILATLE